MLFFTIRGCRGITTGNGKPLHTKSRKFIISSHSLFSPSILPSWHHHLHTLFFFTHILLCVSSWLQHLILLSSTQMCLLQAAWYDPFRWSNRAVSRFRRFDGLDLLVSVVPDQLCFLQGSWGIHLCLLLWESVFEICRFLQSCKTYHMILCGVLHKIYNALSLHVDAYIQLKKSKYTLDPEVGLIFNRSAKMKHVNPKT